MGESKETALADLTEFYQGKLEEMELTLQQVANTTDNYKLIRHYIGPLTDARSAS